MKIYEDNKLIWDSETRAEHTTGDAFTWLSCYLVKKVENIQNPVLPACNYMRDVIEDNIELCQIKLDLLSKIKDLLDNETTEFAINFDQYNCFSRGTEFNISK